jgi:hypothetical protein
VISLLWAATLAGSLQAPDTLQVNEQTNPTGVTKPDFRATNRMVSTQPAVGFEIHVSTSSSLTAGGVFTTITHWDSPVGLATSPGTILVNPGRIGQISFSPFGYVFEPVPAPQDVATVEVPYGWGGGTVLNPLQWNTSYFWQMRLWRPNGGSGNYGNSGWSAPASFTMGQPSALAAANGNGSPTDLSWRFVALPIQPGTTVPASELLDDVLFLYKLDEPTRSWILITSPAENLVGGQGYLAWTSASAVLDLNQGNVAHGDFTRSFSYTTSAVPLGNEATANEFRGNHLLGNPYNTSIDWDWVVRFEWLFSPPAAGTYVSREGDVQYWGATPFPASPTVSASYFKWDGTQYLTYNGVTRLGGAGPTIAPFQAVGIVALDPAAQIQFREPPPKSGVGVGKAAAAAKIGGPAGNANRWGLTLAVASAGALDTENIVGVDFEAQDDWDLRDSEEPGPFNATWVLLSMDHSSWAVYPRLYTHDFRKTPSGINDEVVWTLTLDGNTGQPATLSWPDFTPTADWSFTLEDPGAGASVDLGAASSYDTAAVNGKSTLLLRARRLTEFKGSLELSAPGTPTSRTIVAGTAGVPMLDLELRAVDEPVTVREVAVTHGGTGDPAHATVSLMRNGLAIAGPTPFTGTQVIWTGLTERLELGQPQTWTVVYDFDGGAQGTYSARVEAGLAEGLGAYSAKSLVPAPASLQGSAMDVMTPSESSGGGCGLLGLEALLLALAARAGRRKGGR